jgi:acylphosphatase
LEKLTLHYKITVIGKVQGVWFRKYTREAALSFGVKGLVENSDDGSVYVEAEGSQDDLDQFLLWLHQGSPMSRVDKVTHREGQPVGYSTFEISR